MGLSTRLDDRVVIVTGGASGIGRGCCELVLGAGGSVVVADVNEAAAAAAASELAAESGGRCVAATVDVTSEPQVALLVKETVAAWGRLDAVVNSAGVGSFAPLATADVEEWRRVIEVNLVGTMLVVKHAAAHMARGGSIVNIASLNAVQPAAGMSAYCASKSAVAMLTQVAAMEFGPLGIRVNAVAPGLIDTPLAAPLLAPGLVEEFVENTTIGRHGTPADVAAAVLFLVSDMSAWMSGELMMVDGGARTGRYPNLLRRFTEP